MYKSIKNNIWKVEQNAKNTLEDFRQKIKLDQIWPPPITHIINCIHHMQTANYSASQSDLNFSNKMHEYVDYTESFAVQKFLAVVSKTNKGNDVRKQITISLVKQIIEALPTIYSSYIEAILFASIISLVFFGFVENRRSSLIWNIRSYFRN